jgi:hypothetical protein
MLMLNNWHSFGDLAQIFAPGTKSTVLTASEPALSRPSSMLLYAIFHSGILDV